MAGEVQQLREFIEQCLRSQPRASLVEAVSYFDHQNHLLPSAWRLNQAVTELSVPVALSSDGLHLEISPQTDAVQLSDSDMSRIIEAYMTALRAR
jgi:hypothetical protein